MSHDQIAFYVDATGAASTKVSSLADGIHTVSGTDMLVNGLWNAPIYAMATVTCTTAANVAKNARLSAPSLGSMPLELAVTNDMNGTASTTYTMPESAPVEVFTSPVGLSASEALSAYVGSGGTAANNLHTVVVGMSDGRLQNPYKNMPIYTARYTAAATLTAHAYTNTALTVTNQTLKAGRYAVVGMKAYGATMQAARLVFAETSARPGCIGVTANGHRGHPIFRQGNLGEWGQFTHVNLPTIDCLANAADSAQVFDLDLVKIG